MFLTVRHITVDSADVYALATFWSAALGHPLHPEDEPGDPEAIVLTGEDGPDLLFVTVPERKERKNRLHLDLQPVARTRDQEVERLLALGATLVADHREPDGKGWVTLADPEGNEFCVERSRPERGGGAPGG